MKWYVNDEMLYAGITLKSENEMMEMNNMALHACEDEAVIVQNRKRLADSLNCSLNDFVCAEQTHSANFYEVTEADIGRGTTDQRSAIFNTDALYTVEKNIVLCTFTADCVPVFFYAKEANVIGVIHSGWKGTVQEIVKKTLLHVSQTLHCPIEYFNIHIGMALSQCIFEVDTDVYVQFKTLRYPEPFIQYNEQTNKYHIDNQLVVKEQCKQIGILERNILIDRTCTYTSKYGFSYRENKKSGRHLGFILQT